jgi:DUF4097 and DUF4098 domain-containing protein YvlB
MKVSLARNPLLIAGLLLLVVCSTGCDMPLYRATDTLSEVFQTNEKPTIVVETFNGSIDISNGTGNEVVVEVTKRGSGFSEEAARDSVNNVEVSIAQDDNQVVVKAHRLWRRFGDCGASVIIVAPPGANVVLRSSNGYIVAEGLQGPIDARTSNAKIDVVEASGTIDVHTSNGPILIEAEQATVDANTSNASIRFAGSLAGDENKLHTSNASIDVRLPADSQFEIDASTSNSVVDCDFDAETHKREDSRRRKLSATVGDDPQFALDLSTSNGSINIRKQRSSD